MVRVAFLTIIALALAAGVVTLLTYLVLVVKGYYAADRVEARKVKEAADDAVYELIKAEKIARMKRKK